MVGFKKLAILLGASLGATAAPIAGNQPEARATQTIPGKYIITLKQGIAARDVGAHLSWLDGVHSRNSIGRRALRGVEKTYSINHFHAYAGEFDSTTIEEIKASPDVSLSHSPTPQPACETIWRCTRY